MNKEKVYLQLFHRECKGSPAIEMETVDNEWLNTLDYKNWLASKSDILQDEVTDSLWIKTCTEGYITEVEFLPDGTLNEFKLFDRLPTTGHWALIDGVLSVSISKGDNRYQFFVIGRRENSIYSAIEYKNNQLHSYLKLIPSRPK
ncbi:hypothetical protein [Vibrio genomosp. F10]|uniref:hypothetical protein n=1 Tax=Vibrio genomosp. F10 TaxID=723171 RepID=UPI0002EB93C0|nr:hypothetical protein [Vibrio genomosp. F10]OEF06497.1 hypothetical protein A1QI_05985 [Vibrio genomosp. F10 str. 9ZB36]